MDGRVGSGTVMCPQSWRCSQLVLSFPIAIPSLLCLCYAFVMFSFGVLCSWSFPIITGASWISTELPILLQSFPVFTKVSRFPLMFPSCCQRFSFSARVLTIAPELLLLHWSCCFLPWRSFAMLPLSSESFPTNSYDFTIES